MTKGGREQALRVGANIMMPNITPGIYRNNYALYNNKPGIDEEAEDSCKNMESIAERVGGKIVYGERGDSKHFMASNVS